MQSNYFTERLTLNELSLNNANFINELVNTPEWIKFIGDRNIHTQDEAKEYVEKIIENPNINYWVVKLKSQNISIGIITFLKRDYLEHYDIGFAFLPKYSKNGFAYEATIPVLNDAVNNHNHRQILATTVRENTNSIKLLEKLGLRYEKEIENGKDLLLIYSVNDENYLSPHYMFYAPYLTNADIGNTPTAESRGPVIVNGGSTILGERKGPFGYIILPVGAMEKAKIIDDNKELLKRLIDYKPYFKIEHNSMHH